MVMVRINIKKSGSADRAYSSLRISFYRYFRPYFKVKKNQIFPAVFFFKQFYESLIIFISECLKKRPWRAAECKPETGPGYLGCFFLYSFKNPAWRAKRSCIKINALPLYYFIFSIRRIVYDALDVFTSIEMVKSEAAGEKIRLSTLSRSRRSVDDEYFLHDKNSIP